MLNYDQIINAANGHYVRLKVARGLIKESSLPYMAPEILPKIESDQVKAIAMAIIDLLDQQNKQ